MRRGLLALLLVACGFAVLPPGTWAQESKPEEYQEEEFPPWLRKLRRGEIILFGSLPFAVFFISYGYDTFRYIAHLDQEDARRYAPWPFRPANPVPYTNPESIGVGVAALAASFAFSLADFLIGEVRERRLRER